MMQISITHTIPEYGMAGQYPIPYHTFPASSCKDRRKLFKIIVKKDVYLFIEDIRFIFDLT